MAAPSWIAEILKILKTEGKVPQCHTGKVALELNLGQGGINTAELTIKETIK